MERLAFLGRHVGVRIRTRLMPEVFYCITLLNSVVAQRNDVFILVMSLEFGEGFRLNCAPPNINSCYGTDSQCFRTRDHLETGCLLR